ncbi:NAD-dependent epimerase/dehydratase family protein [Longirhabdus pacifica]|uniref:NAD-dependent epimerase/dehydratase family protein n=1 Tax=Longirhabdus pacifica TaxID=2305227 RepID=UPI001008D5F7|nr:NAD-dependent epimerase/dehydratase family protein [Longirhabdus pacifica]
MKRVLITGKNGYIGNQLERWLMKFPDDYVVHKISVRDDLWRNSSFSDYDVIIHLAGIAHVSLNPKMKEEYYKVNRDLTIEIAKKSKEDGVKQFIFMSSIIVYGKSVERHGMIDESTIPKPNNFYGMSKLDAEKGITLLESNDFKISVIRPPMIYGKGSKGNYSKLSKLAKLSPIFPDIDNKRSMLHIDNLREFIKVVIDRKETGLFFPQNKEYVKTSELVKIIAEVSEKKIWITKLLNPIIKLMRRVGIVNKIFGNLVYDHSMSNYDNAKYQIRTFRKSIELTELESGQL